MNTISNAVEKYRQLILDAERYIWANPETGYREVKTTKYLADRFTELGYELTMAEGITGFYTVIDTGREGPEVLVMGELDSVICAEHKDADPETGAVHSCGHNAQCAALLGIAAALTDKDVLDGLCGRIRLCAVPAEELLEIEFRSELRRQGKIKYYGGKSEFLSRGYFDGVDLAFMVHTGPEYYVRAGSVGCLAKNITYKGVAAHAGGSPWLGRNALYAATCGLNAVNAIRETFKDSELVRVHPIITTGGSMVNAIPDKVVLESYVRGATFDAIAETNAKVNRALCGAALSLGTNIDIEDIPGYAPLINNKDMIQVAVEAAEIAIPEENFWVDPTMSTGSTDMGDICSVMPAFQPYARGRRGTAHGADYEIYDPESACVKNAKWQLTMLKILLGNGGARAKEIIKNFKPLFPSKEAYLEYLDSLWCSGDRITYHDNNTAEIDTH